MCKHTHARTHTATILSWQNHFNTNSVRAQPGSYKTSCTATKQTAFLAVMKL